MAEEEEVKSQQDNRQDWSEELIALKIASKAEVPTDNHMQEARKRVEDLFRTQELLVDGEKAYSEHERDLIVQTKSYEKAASAVNILPESIRRNLEQHVGEGKYIIIHSDQEVLIAYPIKGAEFEGTVYTFLLKEALSADYRQPSQIRSMYIENSKGQVLKLHALVGERYAFALNQQQYREETAAAGLGIFGVSLDGKYFKTTELAQVERLRTFIHEDAHAVLGHEAEKTDEEADLQLNLFLAKCGDLALQRNVKDLIIDEEGKPNKDIILAVDNFVDKVVIWEQQAWAFTVEFVSHLEKAGFIDSQEFKLEKHVPQMLAELDRYYWDVGNYSFFCKSGGSPDI